MTISEKSAYIKGLADGMNLDTSKAEGKLISELIDLASQLSSAIEAMDTQYSTLEDCVDEIDADLGELEEFVYMNGCDCEDDESDEDEDCDGNCEGCDGCDFDDDGMRCLMCANCGETICFDESLDPGEIICPACGKPAAKEADADTEE